MNRSTFTAKIQLFHLGFIAEFIIGPTHQSNHFQKLSKWYRYCQRFELADHLKVNGPQSGRIWAEFSNHEGNGSSIIYICRTVKFDRRPSNFMTLKASWLDHDHVSWNVRILNSIIWNLCRILVSPSYRTSLETNRTFHFRQREQKTDPFQNQESFLRYDPLGRKIHVSANQNRHLRPLTENWAEMYQEDRRGWDHRYLKWSSDLERSIMNLGNDLTVTIFIESVVV